MALIINHSPHYRANVLDWQSSLSNHKINHDHLKSTYKDCSCVFHVCALCDHIINLNVVLTLTHTAYLESNNEHVSLTSVC